MIKGKEVSAIILGVEFVGLIILSIACFAKAQYYQGRIDFKNEMTGKLDKYIKDLEDKEYVTQLLKKVNLLEEITTELESRILVIVSEKMEGK